MRRALITFGLAAYSIVASGCATPTKALYDVNGDGIQDIVYRDNQNNPVWRELNGQEVHKVPDTLRDEVWLAIRQQEIRRPKMTIDHLSVF